MSFILDCHWLQFSRQTRSLVISLLARRRQIRVVWVIPPTAAERHEKRHRVLVAKRLGFDIGNPRLPILGIGDEHVGIGREARAIVCLDQFEAAGSGMQRLFIDGKPVRVVL